MTQTPIHAGGVSRPSSPYSQALVVEARRTLYISGQVPVDENGALVGKGTSMPRPARSCETSRRFAKLRGPVSTTSCSRRFT